MAFTYPTPMELGIKIPGHLIEQRFRAGFLHALEGKQLTRVEHLKLSFREGYRAGKLVIREQRRRQGILTFPVQGRMAFRMTG
ncbi:MAG: hypothetical protein OEZ39_07275 [Gammaproteobacteria bacterium]|nr:hypothetical protein [Gammaproteobacteria bacterium]MDH5651659.1 hypothetical protein [Gammaproteobacteria bacterium]